MKKFKTTPKEEKTLLKKIQENTESKKKSKKIIRQMTNDNNNFVKFMVTRYFSYTKLDYEELLSEGIKSLPKAILKFNPESKNRLAAYAGYWVTQHVKTYLEKIKLFKSSATNNNREVIYYDSAMYQKEEKNNFSLFDNVSSGSYETSRQNIRNHDIAKCVNSLINSLADREMIVLTRLTRQIVPKDCLDVFFMLKEEEKESFFKELKIPKKIVKNSEKMKEFLSEINCEEKIKTSPIIKKYLKMFEVGKKYNLTEIASIINKSENYLRKLRQECFEKMQEEAKKRNLFENLQQNI